MIKNEDLEALVYFHKYKGDMTRYVNYEKIKKDIPADILDAMSKVQLAEKYLDFIMKSYEDKLRDVWLEGE